MKKPRLPPELDALGPGELFVHETFFSIQGEGTCAGMPCFFLRLAGCSLRCRWCDTRYAFHEGQRMSVRECLERASEIGSRLVEVTGGEPLLQESVYALMRGLCDRGHQVLLETSGALPIDRVDARVRRIVDWKPPGSGEVDRNEPRVLDALRPGDELKLVILDRSDYEWARDWLRGARRTYPLLEEEIPVHFSPVSGRLRNLDLATWILEDRLPVRLQVQIHKYIWPPDTRGV